MKSTPLYILRLSITLLLITALVAAALAGINAITKEQIAANKDAKLQQAIAQVLPDDVGTPISEAVNNGIVKNLYRTDSGYAVEVALAGFNAEITMMVGIVDGKVTGIAIVSHTETAGLGAVAGAQTNAGQTFRDQFIGASDKLTVDKDGGGIDSLTGATITSRAITEGVNAALDYVSTLG